MVAWPSRDAVSQLADEPVADAGLGEEELRLGRVGLELLAQVGHMDQKVMSLVLGIRSQDLAQNLPMGKHPSGMAGQQSQEGVFGGRQLHFLSIQTHGAASSRRAASSIVNVLPTPGAMPKKTFNFPPRAFVSSFRMAARSVSGLGRASPITVQRIGLPVEDDNYEAREEVVNVATQPCLWAVTARRRACRPAPGSASTH